MVNYPRPIDLHVSCLFTTSCKLPDGMGTLWLSGYDYDVKQALQVSGRTGKLVG